jgi:transcriptional regulator with XRE-family HTH domain
VADDASLVQLVARLRALRGQAGLTQRELSPQVHVSDSSLSRYFAGQALPPWEVVEALAELAGADQVELRRCRESASEARKRARFPESDDPADQR